MADPISSVTVTIPLYTKVGDGPLLHLGDARIEVPVEVSAVRYGENGPGEVRMKIPENFAVERIKETLQRVETQSSSRCSCDSDEPFTLGPQHADNCPMLVRARQRPAIAETSIPGEAPVPSDVGDPRAGE